jgi:hypothetical protein
MLRLVAVATLPLFFVALLLRYLDPAFEPRPGHRV